MIFVTAGEISRAELCRKITTSMEITGYIAAALIGLSLGLTGGGGSILTVPVLVYFFRMQPLYATSYSLFIVGFTSLTGALKNYIH